MTMNSYLVKFALLFCTLIGLSACGEFQGSVAFEKQEKSSQSEDNQESDSPGSGSQPTFPGSPGDQSDGGYLPIDPMPPSMPSEALCHINFTNSTGSHKVILERLACENLCDEYMANNPHSPLSCSWNGAKFQARSGSSEKLCHVAFDSGASHKVMMDQAGCEKVCQTHMSNNPGSGMVCSWDGVAFQETSGGKLCHIAFDNGASHKVMFGQGECINLCNTYKSNNPTSSFTCQWGGMEVGRN